MERPAHETIRLLHRRRGWGITGGLGLLAFIVYAIVGDQPVTGSGGNAAGAVVVAVLLVVGVSGLVIALIDTIRLRSHPAPARATALAHAPHHSLHVHPFQFPPRHKGSWGFLWVVLIGWTFVAVTLLPSQVDGVAYLAHAGEQTTFTAVSHTQVCHRGCTTVTNGTLGNGADAVWPASVPLGQSFPVRAPVWSWGHGRTLISSATDAVSDTLTALIFEVITVLVAFGGRAAVREFRSRDGGRRDISWSGDARRAGPHR
jgi:hypothetical protein